MTVLLPILVPLGVAALLLTLWRQVRWQRGLSLGGSAGYGVAALALYLQVAQEGVQVVQLGNWPAPFGISLVADPLSTLMILATAVVNLCVAMTSLGGVDGRREAFGYYPLVQVLVAGVSGAFLTGDLFNLYVWFEVMLMASFVLLALGGGRAQVEGALKYVSLNLIGSVFFLTAVGLLYGLTGSLNMADLAGRVPVAAAQSPGLVNAISMLFLIAFGIKAAVFPLYNWLPASYPTAPVAVVAMMAGLLTKVGVYALLRLFTLVFTTDLEFVRPVLVVISVLTMVTGVLGAYAQNEFRRVLSFHIVSQIGYMTLALALGSVAGVAAAIFFILHNIVAKTNLFLIGGIAQRLTGSSALAKMGGLYTSAPWLAGLFLVSAMSLAGLPPLAGFWGKLFVVRAAFEAQELLLGGIGLAVGLVTLLSMLKLWNEAFWKPLPEGQTLAPVPKWQLGVLAAPVFLLAGLAVVMGMGVAPVAEACRVAAQDLIDPSETIRAVLGGGR